MGDFRGRENWSDNYWGLGLGKKRGNVRERRQAVKLIKYKCKIGEYLVDKPKINFDVNY